MFGLGESNTPVTVISLGGSAIIPEMPNGPFIKAFVEAIKERVAAGRRFVVVTGGGGTNRHYLQALRSVRDVTPEEADWMGIYVSRLNGELVRLSFGAMAHPEINIDPTKKMNWKESVLLAAGWMPGRSTDYDAILLAKMYGAKNVVNVSNIDYVYTADPKTDPSAKPIPQMTWTQLIAMLPKEWTPRLSAPFDPIAAREAEEQKISVSIVNASDLQNVLSAIDGKEFKGTKVE
jgi:uridylate kinase